MKKILLLGGSPQQVIAIETAKKLGYYTVLCDYLDDNPGQYAADKFYLVSTTDKDAILGVAEKENIDGILAYASDPAAPTAAYVAEKLNLPGNPYESVDILCNKDKFRYFLKQNGFNVPNASGYSNVNNAVVDINEGKFKFPIIIKPVDSSGSKGVSVVKSVENAESAIKFSLEFSRCNRFIVEEFVEKDHDFLIGGDIFIVDGEIKIWGLMNCHRDENVNDLVPVGKSYPADLKNEYYISVKDTLQKLVDILNIKFGAMNVELVVDKNGKVYPIDIGPRSGGNMIPDLLGFIFKKDIVELSVLAAMGESVNIDGCEFGECYSTYNLHSSLNGTLDRIVFSDEIEKKIIRKCIYKNIGDSVEYFDCAPKCLGIIFMKFDSVADMKTTMQNIDKNIEVDLL